MSGPDWHVRYYSLTDSGMGAAGLSEAVAEQWLAADERETMAVFRSPARRMSWVAGRIAAKRTLLESGCVPDVEPSVITIVSRDRGGRGIAPSVRVGGRELGLALSISHTDRGILIGVATSTAMRIGVDLVLPVERAAGFRRMWFSESEQMLMQLPGGRFTPALLWAAKEAAFKTCRGQASFVPRQFEIRPHESGVLSCRTAGRSTSRECQIQCWQVDGQVAALAVRNIGHTSTEPMGHIIRARLTNECPFSRAFSMCDQTLGIPSSKRRLTETPCPHGD